jgi:uncharacterized protein YicC (UPF0701 family)
VVVEPVARPETGDIQSLAELRRVVLDSLDRTGASLAAIRSDAATATTTSDTLARRIERVEAHVAEVRELLEAVEQHRARTLATRAWTAAAGLGAVLVATAAGADSKLVGTVLRILIGGS